MRTPKLRTSLAALLALSAVAVAAPSDIDRTVKPGDDFYRFANNIWLKTNSIPAGRASYDTSSGLRDETARRVRELIQDADANTAPNPDPTLQSLRQKIGDYYASQMDGAAIEAKGLAPLSGEIAVIAAIKDHDALSAYLGSTIGLDDGSDTQPDAIFGVWIHQGFHDPSRYLPHIVQGGLGLDRDTYLDPAPDKAAARETYRAHIAVLLKLAGLADPDARAARVLDLEIAIAKAHASDADTADIVKTDNAWHRGDFDAKAPGLNWRAYFKAAGLDAANDFVVWQPAAVTGTAALVASTPLDTWKDYLAVHRIAHYASVLPAAYGDAAAPDRTPQAIAATNAALGEAVGRLYVARYFPPESKAAASVMVENIRAAYRARIPKLTWMSPETKEKALAKLAALKIGLGYPDSWTDYSDLAILRGDAFGNLKRVETFALQRGLAKLGGPVDPGEWTNLLPQIVGAVIYFTPNTEQFSAGLFQPPYFDPTGDAASNYGSAGAGLAHEISHSFDELGNIYDAQGNLGMWWPADDLARYRAADAPLAAQLDADCPQPGLCVSGKRALSESVADLAGIETAHDAYIMSLKGHPDVVKNGLTGEQRFFLAFAQRWRRLQTPDNLRQQIATDIHPPGEYRADNVRNVDVWYKAFGVKPGDKLYLDPKARVHVW
ncbi:MAG TPA: M13 family metallopeptidase [Rhizomicrobium sp.]|jgi:predicted metalloendopeptidase|nr:M13 family metallopeptidase [Rhizomicrobium sp.]